MATVKQSLKANRVNQPDLVALLSNMQTAINALRTDHNTLIAKLNLDAGVTDTDYAASTATAVTGV